MFMLNVMNMDDNKSNWGLGIGDWANPQSPIPKMFRS